MKNNSAISLSIFANFFINNEERFLRMKDSFYSFNQIPANRWVINIRGKYATQAKDFLEAELGKKVIVTLLNSKKGWFYDTRQMLPNLQTEYVLFWLEDQINLFPIHQYSTLLQELKSSHADFMLYTFFQNGLLRKRYLNFQNKTELTLINSFEVNKNNVHYLRSKDSFGYILSAPGIYSLKLFKKIALSNHPFLKRWPKECPFDWEKTTNDLKFLPFRLAEPKNEFFASIDDDFGLQGYSLISRGIYPQRVNRSELVFYRNSKKKWSLNLLKKLIPSKLYRLMQRINYTFNL